MIFYIWEPCYLIDKIALSLIDASHRNVNCKIILDSIGSINFFNTLWHKIMLQEGIDIIEYRNFKNLKNFLKRIDLRQHKKVILIDNNIVYTGSMNLINANHFKKTHNIGKWIDIMIRIKSFFLVEIIKTIFFSDWELETGLNITKNINVKKFNSCKKNNRKKINFVQVITSSPGLSKKFIHSSLIKLILLAKKNLVITTPYFIPSQCLLKILCHRAQNGLNINIIIPENNDCFLIYWANRFFFRELLLSNIKVYLYKENFLHSKSIVIDNNISVLGTINFDIRSILLNFEIAFIIKSLSVNRKLSLINKKYIANSKLLNLQDWDKRSISQKFLENIVIYLKSIL